MKAFSGSIRTQLILATIVALLVLAGTLELMQLYQQQSVLINSERRVGLTLIRSVNNTINSVRSFISSLDDIAELATRLAELVELNSNIDFITVTSDTGQVIFHSDSQYEGETIAAFARLSDETTLAASVPGYGEVFLTSLSFDSEGLTDTPRYLVIVASASEPIYNLLLSEALSSVLVAVLFTVIAGYLQIVFLQYYFVRPVEQLTQATHAVESGDLNVRVDVRRSNEMGQLAGSFNRMTHELAGLINELEERVQERTRELEIARDQAERANNIKSAFLASISHELRTPLNAVLNFSQFLAGGVVGPVNEEQVDMLERITASGKHLLNLINDVLDISKIESGSLRLLVEENVNLADELETLVHTGHALLKEKPVELRLEVAPDAPHITADKRRVRQVLLNLISNACKFTETGEIVVSFASKDGQAYLTVRDTGPGIDTADFETIFETFRQTTAGLRQGSGTGLGLAISRRLAEAHGGRLWVESEVGAGTTFHLVLPVTSPALVEMMMEANS